MKQMQNFREWLSAANATSAPHQRHLAALTRLNRAQLSNASNELTWFMWDAPQSASAS